MTPLEVAGLVSLIGLLTQCAVAGIFLTLFVALGRSVGRPVWFRDWSVSFAALTIGLSAMALRFTAPLLIDGEVFRTDEALSVRCSYALYSGAKALHVAFLCLGVLQFAREPISARARRRWIAASVLLALAVALPSGQIATFMALQAPVMAVGFALACTLLLRLPRERRDAGTRMTALAMGATALLWTFYGIAFARTDGVAWPIRRDLWTALMSYNSYIDLVLMTVLAAGLTAMFLTDGRRRMELLERERAELSAALQRDEKLRALGTLASGVAHELNNPLAAILASAEELRSVELVPARRARLDDLIGQVPRSSSIVKTLTSLRLGLLGEFRPVRAGELDGAASASCAQEARGLGVELELEVHSDVELRVDASALEPALVSVSADEACFAVEDAGAGVPLALRERIFEPFFSTRSKSGAQGLGLSLADATARALHVMIVDDEPLLRDILASFGRRHGWNVELAEDGLRALELLCEEASDPDCVICDLRMPGLSGAELHARVQAARPELAARFVFLSGDVSSPEAEDVRARVGLPILAKPLPFAQLHALVEGLAARSAQLSAT